jgi:hypothetical protein
VLNSAYFSERFKPRGVRRLALAICFVLRSPGQ